MPEDGTPESLKVCLLLPRRLRAFGKRELRIFAAGEIVELERLLGLRLIGSGLADGVESDSKTTRGAPISGFDAAKKSVKPPAKSAA